jgi:hypothetical protein
MPTLRRRKSDPSGGGRAPLRSSLADAAWAVEDRVVWGTADFFRAVVDALLWPFRRIAWAVEHWLIWPIQEETALWSRPVRATVLAMVLVLAGAGVAAGVVVSDPSTSDQPQKTAEVVSVSPPEAAAPAVPVEPATPSAKAEEATGGPVLHGSSPDFDSEQGGGVTRAQAATEPPASHIAAGTADTAGAAGATAGSAKGTAAAAGSDVAGPEAIAVARRFAAAFVLYETGRNTAPVKEAIRETTTPDLTKALLRRPPRLPADVKVPKAKVLNIVAGPKAGDTYTLSVSLLRVGVTSELRIDMKKTPAGKNPSTAAAGDSGKRKPSWLVTDVRG